MNEFLTTKETADALGISPARVRQMILDGVIKAEKFGRENAIPAAELKRLLETKRPPHRPKKNTQD